MVFLESSGGRVLVSGEDGPGLRGASLLQPCTASFFSDLSSLGFGVSGLALFVLGVGL